MLFNQGLVFGRQFLKKLRLVLRAQAFLVHHVHQAPIPNRVFGRRVCRFLGGEVIACQVYDVGR